MRNKQKLHFLIATLSLPGWDIHLDPTKGSSLYRRGIKAKYAQTSRNEWAEEIKRNQDWKNNNAEIALIDLDLDKYTNIYLTKRE